MNTTSIPKICRIALPTDVLAEILRHFSRRELCKQFYFVNREFCHVATLPSKVPNIHLIRKISFNSSKLESPGNFLACLLRRKKAKKKSIVGLVGLRCNGIDLPENYQSMACPGPFVRFSEVVFERSVEESMVQFMCNFRPEPFAGCKLHFDNCITQTTLHLLENVFQNPYSATFWRQETLANVMQIFQTKGISNCNKVILKLRNPGIDLSLESLTNVTEESVCALINWLKNESSQTAIRQLKLLKYPSQFCLNIVKQLRRDFKDVAVSWPEFIVTFDNSEFEKSDEFCETKESTGDRLSLFNLLDRSKHYDPLDRVRRIHRIWHRRVISEDADAVVFSYLQYPDTVI